MRYKYFFFEKHRPDLVDWLNEKGIKFTLDGGGCVPVFVNFTLWSNNTNIYEYLDHLDAMRVKKPVITAEYTASELSNAQLLIIEPRRQCIEITNSGEAYQYSCTWVNQHGIRKVGHEDQKGFFAISKEPSTKTQTAFWHEDTGFAEIFTDSRVYNLAKQYNLEGIVFNPVYLKSGTRSENIFQMTSENKINKQCIEFGHGERRLTCHLCGKEQFFINSAYQLHLYVDKIELNQDFYVTEHIFGEGIPYPVYIISQRFYQILKENKLTGNLTLLPVVEAVK